MQSLLGVPAVQQYPMAVLKTVLVTLLDVVTQLNELGQEFLLPRAQVRALPTLLVSCAKTPLFGQISETW